mmetsp:Transcript_42460/g.51766  ORF Transcript_42460/g.51766 Transcript_42460/m.51766 type:complete len:138 (+) Transcript_42460:107-520(+)|eukprot:CAMPEP_0172509516 /NCGR_PEP_ID=MMETSP1066-20121228/220974_1 /TAXON_ID=671091 /ORGANISM="Coscinodiscus wailesii, Strain CCMP2513" /LENGTH=137 /DNA_ID=CAMNT_0013288035 /DNA_START=101 /DNA_END=514 /DNA_ORIENTATION=+
MPSCNSRHLSGDAHEPGYFGADYFPVVSQYTSLEFSIQQIKTSDQSNSSFSNSCSGYSKNSSSETASPSLKKTSCSTYSNGWGSSESRKPYACLAVLDKKKTKSPPRHKKYVVDDVSTEEREDSDSWGFFVDSIGDQ